MHPIDNNKHISSGDLPPVHPTNKSGIAKFLEQSKKIGGLFHDYITRKAGDLQAAVENIDFRGAYESLAARIRPIAHEVEQNLDLIFTFVMDKVDAIGTALLNKIKDQLPSSIKKSQPEPDTRQEDVKQDLSSKKSEEPKPAMPSRPIPSPLPEKFPPTRKPPAAPANASWKNRPAPGASKAQPGTEASARLEKTEPRSHNRPLPRPPGRKPPVPPRPSPASVQPTVAAKAQDTAGLNSVASWMNYFEKSTWDNSEKKYTDIQFDPQKFSQLLDSNNAKFSKHHDPDEDFGFIEKKDVNPNTKIFVRADLHGDLKSLMENLKAAQKQGLLDHNFKCRPHAQLVFLGDYGDRGPHTMQVLELLIRLRMENPNQVTLIRGNHENVDFNKVMHGEDSNLGEFLLEDEQRNRLNSFYDTLPLTMYIGQKGSSKEIQYVQFTHGLFEISTDPFSMLSSNKASGRMAVKKNGELSQRIRNLPVDLHEDYLARLEETKDKTKRRRLKQLHGAQRVMQLDEENLALSYYTSYSWGDMAVSKKGNPPKTKLKNLGERKWKVSPEDARNYNRAISSGPLSPSNTSTISPNVKFIFRGHEHIKQHHTVKKSTGEDKVIISTMPTGMNINAFNSALFKGKGQFDTAYILTTDIKVRDWKKEAYLRNTENNTYVVTPQMPIRKQEAHFPSEE